MVSQRVPWNKFTGIEYGNKILYYTERGDTIEQGDSGKLCTIVFKKILFKGIINFK